MERSCQAQLLAMAAGTPKRDPPRVRHVHARADRLPARRLVPVPAALAGDLPHRPRAVRLTRGRRHAARPRPRRPHARHRVARGAVRPLGDLPVHRRRDRRARCSTRSPRRPSPGCACIGAAIALLAGVPPLVRRGWTRRQLGAAAAVRHRHRADEHVLLPGDRPHRSRQERRHRTNTGRQGQLPPADMSRTSGQPQPLGWREDRPPGPPATRSRAVSGSERPCACP